MIMRVQNNHTKPKDILITHWGLAAVLKNYLKYHHSVWKSPQNVSFPANFCPVLPKNLPNWSFLAFFYETVNVARFARNVEWDFFCDFQPQCRNKVESSLKPIAWLEMNGEVEIPLCFVSCMIWRSRFGFLS